MTSTSNDDRNDAVATPLFDDSPPDDAPIISAPVDRAFLQMGAILPKSIYLGTSGWNFPAWRGSVYGSMSGTKRLAREGLRAYSNYPVFRTVEIERNYYRALSVSEFALLGAQVPDSFRFVVKAPQRITDSMLRDESGKSLGRNPAFLNATSAHELFLARVTAGLGEKVGALVFQLSAWPSAALRRPIQKQAVVSQILAFFEALQCKNLADHTLACELRNPQLLTPRLMTGLKVLGIRPVIGLHPAMPSIVRQMAALRFYESAQKATQSGAWHLSGPLIIRWSQAVQHQFVVRKRDWQPFDKIQEVDPLNRAGIVNLLKQSISDGQNAFVIAGNRAEGCAPKTISAIAQMLVRDHLDARRVSGT